MRYRSFFWPAVLILVGVVALLVNTGQIALDRLVLLTDLWPLILIVVGIELIVRRSVHGTTGDIAAALIIVLAIVGAAVYVAIAPNPVATQSMTASGEVGGLSEASADISAGAATITVQGSSDLGSNLYRAHIDYSGPKPEVRLDRSSGVLSISQKGSSFPWIENRRFVLKLEVNPGVPWSITLNTGASTTTINLPQVHVTGVTIHTGASRDDITLGTPSGIVPVEVNGGALMVNVHRPRGTAASVSVSGGAVTLRADGRDQHGIGDLKYESDGFSSAPSGYRVEVNGGACTVTLDTSTPSG